MKILAVGAHFDDVELGCGGTVARHARDGDQVHIYVATNSGYSDYAQKVIRKPEVALAEGRRAAEIMGARDLMCGEFATNDLRLSDELVLSLRKVIERSGFDMVYTHWTGDTHLDHRTLGQATLTAARHVPRLFMYRSNYYESGELFRGNYFVDITETIEIKKQAIMAHESEFSRIGEKWLRFFVDQNRNDGQRIGVDYAETFEVIKYLR